MLLSIGPGSTADAGPRELFYGASLTAGLAVGAASLTAEGFATLGQFAPTTLGGSLSLGLPLGESVVADAYAGARASDQDAVPFAGVGVTVMR